jgi:sugar phosphate isomerase/epimerase
MSISKGVSDQGGKAMKLSICSYTFNHLSSSGRMNVFGFLETCKYRYGLQAVEIWNETLASLDEGYLAEVKAGLAEREIVLACLCVDDAHIWEDDAEAREVNYLNALAHLRAAEALGARSVRIDAGGGEQDLAWTDEQFDEIVRRYSEYARRAADNGYRVGPENHWGPETVPANMKRLCEAVDSPAFGVLLHAGRWNGGDAGKGDEMVVLWVMHTHLTPGLSDDGLVRTMTMLRDAGYEGYHSVEMDAARYTEVAVLLAKIRDVGAQWRLAGQTGTLRA